MISTQFGMRRIDEIKPGDKVYSFDEKTQEVSLKRVLQTYEKESDELVHITVGDSVINATPTHPFYVPAKGWTEACELRAGDVLYTVNGEYVVVEQVQHEILEEPITVYNFSVEDNHTYFVGDKSLCVHNTCLTEKMINLLKEDGWSDDIIEAIRKNGTRSEEVAETLRRCNLTEATINGRKTLIQEIDLTKLDAHGKTNLERMKKGDPPLDANGVAIELHHIDQTMDSPYAELPWNEHRGKGQHGTMHDLSKTSEINRPVFGKQREEYWKERARKIEENL